MFACCEWYMQFLISKIKKQRRERGGCSATQSKPYDVGREADMISVENLFSLRLSLSRFADFLLCLLSQEISVTLSHDSGLEQPCDKNSHAC
jgi:hypothetical protein